MNVNNVSLEVVAGMEKQFPDTNKIEIVFAGKSNVGKSSLLNALINRKKLARVSSKPGKTQTINFYNIEDQLYFVDLPGYGYAKVAKDKQHIWSQLIETYLTKRDQIRLVVLLIDIRHELGNNDKLMYDWVVYNGFTPLIVATKLDKLKRSQVRKHLNMIQKSLKLPDQKNIVPFSSVTKQGKDELWEIFDQIIEHEKKEM